MSSNNNSSNNNSSNNNSSSNISSSNISSSNTPKISSKIKSCLDSFIDRLLDFMNPEVKQEVSILKEECKRSILIYFLIAVIVAFICILPKKYVPDISHFRWVAFFCINWALISEIFRFYAIKRSKEARQHYEERLNRATNRMVRLVVELILICVIITQDVLGIGSALVNALPWVDSLAKTVLEFTNGTVEELIAMFSSISK